MSSVILETEAVFFGQMVLPVSVLITLGVRTIRSAHFDTLLHRRDSLALVREGSKFAPLGPRLHESKREQ